MATFRFPGRNINIHWNGYDIKGPEGTVFSIPDQLYEEFESDIRPVEPSLEWIEDNEFDALSASVSAYTLEAAAPITIANTSTGRSISFSSGTAQNGALLAADGSGGVIYIPASTSGINSVIGVNPISASISGGIVSVSLTANYQTAGSYQPAGTYVTDVSGASPISATGTTSISVSINQALITAATAAINAQVVRFLVKNTTGTTIPKGSAVYVSGATGDNALISLASATSDPSSSKTLGITAEAIATDAFGYVIEAGYLTDIDTSATTAGASVWLGNTPGSLAFVTPPAEPSHAVYLGVVVRVQSMNGSILVKVQNGYELDELHDVFTTGVSTSLPLVYSSTSSGWVAQALSSVGIADNAIVTSKIDASAVDSTKIADNAVVSSKINAASIDSTKLADNSVVGTKILDAAVTSAKLADDAVTSSKIIASAVGTAKISSGAATSGQLLRADGTGGVEFATISSGISASGTVRDNEIVRWDGATGASIQNSGVVISDSADVFVGGAIASVPITVTADTASVYNIDLSLGNHFILSNTTTASSPVVVATRTASFTTASTGTITLPAGTTTDDHVLIAVGSDGGTDITCSSSGWTRLAYGAPGTAGYALFTKKIGVSVDTSASFAGLATASCANAVTIRSSSGIIALAGYHSSSSAPNPPAVDTQQNATTVVAIGFLDDVSTTATAAPSGYVNASYSTVASGFQVMLATKAVATAGTEDPGAWTVSADEAVSFTAVFGSTAGASVALINSPTASVTGYGTANAYSALIDYAVTSNPITWDSKISWPGTYPPPANSGGSVIIYTSNGGTTFKGSYVSGY